MQGSSRRTHIRWVYLGVIASFFLVALSAIGLLVLQKHTDHQPPTPARSSPVSTIKAPLYSNVQGSYLFTGTVMMGRAVGTFANGDFNQPFSGMSTLGTYDATVGVLECPITNRDISYQIQHDKLLFNCKPDWLLTLKKYFPIVNLSSNHLHDMGDDGYTETVKNLQSAGFQIVGNFNPHAEPDNCKTVLLLTRLQATKGNTETQATLPVAMCSFNYKTIFSPAPGEIEKIQEWSKLMPVIALMNGGPEYQHTAGSVQTANAHAMIDSGADFVVGNGTHWAQNTEVYKGKLIVYSMGNFIFDQTDYDGRLALNLSVKLQASYNDNLAAWLKVSADCTTDTTACRTLAESRKLTRYTPTYSFDIIASYGGYQKVASKGTAEQQADLETKANWPVTRKAINP